MATDEAETDVLIVGAGPTGLSLAIELGLRGVTAMVVERHPRTGNQPRAKTTNVRSLQHFRRWGIAPALRTAAPLPSDYPTDIVFATRLFGRTLAVIENAFEGAKRRDPRFPEPAQWVPQYTVEAVLRERVETFPSVKIAFNTELEAAEQSAAAVTARVRESPTARSGSHPRQISGRRRRRAQQCPRQIIGAKMAGEHAYALNYNLILRIPELSARRPPAAPSCTGSSTKKRRPSWARWTARPMVFGMTLPPGVTEPDDETIRRRVRAAVGREMEIEILTRDVWAAHRLIADHYREPPHLPGRRCLSSASAVRRLWHESRHRRRRRSRMEACRDAGRLGRRGTARFLRAGTPRRASAHHRRSGRELPHAERATPQR